VVDDWLVTSSVRAFFTADSAPEERSVREFARLLDLCFESDKETASGATDCGDGDLVSPAVSWLSAENLAKLFKEVTDENARSGSSAKAAGTRE